MNCSQFRQFYSDFADGLLDETEEVAFHVHMAECVACHRFDAALEQGRRALRRSHWRRSGVCGARDEPWVQDVAAVQGASAAAAG